jgi:hypothetical protein
MTDKRRPLEALNRPADPEVPELTDAQFEQLDALLAKRGCIALLWSIEDVQEVRPDLDRSQSMAVLAECRRCQNAEIGLNWQGLADHAEDLFPAPDHDEDDEAG